jgi:hypothetical protein
MIKIKINKKKIFQTLIKKNNRLFIKEQTIILSLPLCSFSRILKNKINIYIIIIKIIKKK